MTVLSETVQKRLKFAPNIRLTLITTFGLKTNEYSGNFQNVVTIEDL